MRISLPKNRYSARKNRCKKHSLNCVVRAGMSTLPNFRPKIGRFFVIVEVILVILAVRTPIWTPRGLKVPQRHVFRDCEPREEPSREGATHRCDLCRRELSKTAFDSPEWLHKAERTSDAMQRLCEARLLRGRLSHLQIVPADILHRP